MVLQLAPTTNFQFVVIIHLQASFGQQACAFVEKLANCTFRLLNRCLMLLQIR